MVAGGELRGKSFIELISDLSFIRQVWRCVLCRTKFFLLLRHNLPEYSTQSPVNYELLQSGRWQQAPFLALCKCWALFSHWFRWLSLLASGGLLKHACWSVLSWILKGDPLHISRVLCLCSCLFSSTLSWDLYPPWSPQTFSYASSTQEFPRIHLGLLICTVAWKLFLSNKWGVT